MAAVDELPLRQTVVEVLNRWPSAGVAVGVVRDGTLDWFLGHGVADIRSKAPVTGDTVFRIGSVTKTMTAVAVLQLCEQGLIDLDAPADEYLRTFRLTPAKGVSPPTVRHLLTHTAGIGYWRRLSDLLRPGVGSGVSAARPVSSLADYYHKGLPVEVEPGTKWMYSDHGIATLGQIVEDVTGQPIDRYLRDRVFAPLGMEHTDLVRSESVRARLATGYALSRNGLKPARFREVPLVAAGGVYSTTSDLAHYVAALLSGGSAAHGRILKPETLTSMFEPHYQPDPRVPGMGLGFLLGDEDGHRSVGHDGVVAGFLSVISLAPDDGIGVVVLTNTGRLDSRGAAQPLASALLRRLLGLPDDPLRADLPQHPEVWGEICGWYGPDPGPVTNLFTRAVFGAGIEVRVRRGHLMLQPMTPLPPMRSGFLLHPDDPEDPYVFRVDFAAAGLGTLRVAFSGGPEGERPMRLLVNGMSFEKRPDARNPRLWARGLSAGGAAAVAIHRGIRRARTP
ncbi:MAG TPA: serine hydrolase domain-containing protein [Euzebyales bacterium]|nr:serine hydrolase domain-containing protein [Euzebyales bacterium]